MDYAGGCQCGAIRYRAEGPRDRASVCHCRMCQKASGGPFMAFVRFPVRHVAWSRPPAVFASSTIAERGFCRDCGTPLSYRRIASDYVSVTLQSLDDPTSVTPDIVFSPETKVTWWRSLGDLPAAPDGIDDSGFVNHQHPDG
jgi:hypothetical protein